MPLEVNGTISGSVSNTASISGVVTVPKNTVIPEYEGEYVVSPSADNPVVLETAGTQLRENVTVRQVQETIEAEDDGTGNITLTGNVTVVDDGDGNITF